MAKKEFKIKKIKDLDASTDNQIINSEIDAELMETLNPDISIEADEAENVNASTKNRIEGSKVKSKYVWMIGAAMTGLIGLGEFATDYINNQVTEDKKLQEMEQVLMPIDQQEEEAELESKPILKDSTKTENQ